MSKSILLFAIAGVVGFFVDAGVMLLLKNYLGLYLARGISFLCAVISTWVINKAFTFKGRTSGYSLYKEFVAYFSAMLAGGSINYLVYATLVAFVSFFGENPVFAIAIGSLAGMVLNWVSSNYLIFRKSRD